MILIAIWCYALVIIIFFLFTLYLKRVLVTVRFTLYIQIIHFPVYSIEAKDTAATDLAFLNNSLFSFSWKFDPGDLICSYICQGIQPFYWMCCVANLSYSFSHDAFEWKMERILSLHSSKKMNRFFSILLSNIDILYQYISSFEMQYLRKQNMIYYILPLKDVGR